jgi:RNA polymerase primary sigma factor
MAIESALKSYLCEIGKYPLLKKEDEIALALRMRQGDSEARDTLINSNLRLVVSIAKNYRNNHLSLMDLISEGNMGLMTAVDKFNPDLNFRFSTCATPWIKQAITSAIYNKGANIRLPAHMQQLLSKYRKTVNDLELQLKRIPTQDEVAKAMDITIDKVILLEKNGKDTVSLDTKLDDESDDTIEDLQADDSPTPDEVAYRNDDLEHEQRLINELKPRTQTIIRMRFGLGRPGIDPEDFQNEHTLEEIGAYLGITRERVRQIVNETLADMKVNWNRK